MEAIHQEDQTGFVIVAKSNSAPGGALERARGVSVYFPILSSLYKELVFSKQTEWPGFLLDYASAFLDNKGPNESHALLEAAAETAYVSTVEIEANGNGHQPNSGGIGNMSSPMEVSKAPCLALFEGTTIEEPSKPVKELTGLAFLEMGANRKVRIPGDVDLNVPNTGTVKASTGTPLKLPTGTMVGSAGPSAIAVPMKVPACTLREPSNGNATTELSDGTRIVTNVGGTGFLVLEAIEFGVDDGA
jgi:hypothetical protein